MKHFLSLSLILTLTLTGCATANNGNNNGVTGATQTQINPKPSNKVNGKVIKPSQQAAGKKSTSNGTEKN